MLIRRRLIIREPVVVISPRITSVATTIVAPLAIVSQKTAHTEACVTSLIIASVIEMIKTIAVMTNPKVAMTTMIKDATMNTIKTGLTAILDAMMLAAVMRCVQASKRETMMMSIMPTSTAAPVAAPPQLLPSKV